jgi:hypothetical protein
MTMWFDAVCITNVLNHRPSGSMQLGDYPVYGEMMLPYVDGPGW